MQNSNPSQSLNELVDALIVELGVTKHLVEPFARKILDVAVVNIVELRDRIDKEIENER